MFILGKIKILHGHEDIAEMAFLLYACIYWAIMLAPADIRCDLIDRKWCIKINLPPLNYRLQRQQYQ